MHLVRQIDRIRDLPVLVSTRRRVDRRVMRLLLGVLVWSLVLSACGSSDGLDVVVLRGADLEVTTPGTTDPESGPFARPLTGSGGVVFVSASRYSGSCPPTAEVERDGTAYVLTIGRSGDECTDDANPYTFVIGPDDRAPERLVVREEGEDDLELDLRPAP